VAVESLNSKGTLQLGFNTQAAYSTVEPELEVPVAVPMAPQASLLYPKAPKEPRSRWTLMAAESRAIIIIIPAADAQAEADGGNDEALRVSTSTLEVSNAN
jgi:hypothetical protein